MYKALSPSAMGIKVDSLEQAIKLAKDAGFEGVEIGIGQAADLIDEVGADRVRSMFTDAGIDPAGWGMPVDFRSTSENWQKGLDELPRLAKAAAAIHNLRDADEVFRRKLAAQERDTWDADFCGEPLHQGGFANTRGAPDENRTDHSDIQQKLAEWILSKRYRGVHGSSSFI